MSSWEQHDRVSGRHVALASVAAVGALAEASGTTVVRAEGYASTTLPDATYYHAERRSVQRERIGA